MQDPARSNRPFLRISAGTRLALCWAMLPNRVERPASPSCAQPLSERSRATLSLVPPLHGGAPPNGPASEAPLPDWLDLLLCIVAPCLVALLVMGGFDLVRWVAAAL
jgi:hypothetical protein